MFYAATCDLFLAIGRFTRAYGTRKLIFQQFFSSTTSDHFVATIYLAFSEKVVIQQPLFLG